jgi:hypothetical protein
LALLAVALDQPSEERRQHAHAMVDRRRRSTDRHPIALTARELRHVLDHHATTDLDQVDPPRGQPAQEVLKPGRVSPQRVRAAPAHHQPLEKRDRLTAAVERLQAR